MRLHHINEECRHTSLRQTRLKNSLTSLRRRLTATHTRIFHSFPYDSPRPFLFSQKKKPTATVVAQICANDRFQCFEERRREGASFPWKFEDKFSDVLEWMCSDLLRISGIIFLSRSEPWKKPVEHSELHFRECKQGKKYFFPPRNESCIRTQERRPSVKASIHIAR